MKLEEFLELRKQIYVLEKILSEKKEELQKLLGKSEPYKPLSVACQK